MRNVSPPIPSVARRLMRVLGTEPWWLRGVTWGLVGMIALIAFVQNAPQIIRATFHHRDDGMPAEFVLLDLATQAFVGLAIMLVASVLVNARRVRLPLPLVLVIAVVLGSFTTLNVMSFVFFDGTANLVQANMEARRVALPWACAAVAWYFLRRAGVREAALRAAEMSRRQLEAGVLEARLQALQAQVEPHFLFNTLAHVRRLYRTDPVRARLMLDSFRAYLRSALPQMRGNATTLGREADLARAYLDVQQVRMGRRLGASIAVPASLRDCPFPAMMLLSLVENAIKHGLNPLPQGGTIQIGAAMREATLEVSVTDTGSGMGDTLGSGVGLANIRGRLAVLYGNRAALALSSNAPRGVRAVITVPLITPSRDAAVAAPAQRVAA